jgi:hypothetical protein
VAATKYVLEHFYYGQLVHHSAPQGEARVLARSAGVSDDVVNAYLKHALLSPLEGVPEGSWAIPRMRQAPSLMVQAQVGKFGQVMRHYVVMPAEVLRAMGGNLSAIRVLVESEMPVFETLGDRLPPLELPDVGSAPTETQIDNILELMTFTKNNMQVMESLLGSIVQGVQLVIQGAPQELNARMQFIEGLLALLPPSTRHGITFTTHSAATDQLDVQIRFMGEGAPPAETMIYNWATMTLSGREVEDDYSHFIISQLRLDAELVIQQTQALTGVAGWRVRDMGDRLRDALAYASYRKKLDEALLNGQPVEMADVSRVLAEDPTLPDDLREIYARHVLNFSLALNEVEDADPVAVLLHNNHELADSTLKQMNAAIGEGKAGIVYYILLRWLANPLGPQEHQWVELTHKAALTFLAELIRARDLEGINEFLESVDDASPGAGMKRIVPKIIEVTLPLSVRDAGLAQKLFVMAAIYMDADFVRKLLNTQQFVAQLPKQVGALMPYIGGKDTKTLPAGVLIGVARLFGEQWQPVVALRLAELAVAEKRYTLIDTAVLRGLIRAALSPVGADYSHLLLDIVHSFNTGALQALEDPGPRYLLQILLVQGQYHELVREMIRHARELYPGDLQLNYIGMAHKLFAETPLPPEQAVIAIQAIKEEGLKAVPLAVASMGALEAGGWSPLLKPVADEVMETLDVNPNYLEVMNTESVVALVTYWARQGDVLNTIRAAGFVPTVAAYQESGGLDAIGAMYKLMTWDNQTRVAALELMRRYVRKAEDREARAAVAFFGRELGPEVRRTLEVTYMLKRFMGDMPIDEYAAALRGATNLLQDMAGAYTGRDVPSTSLIATSLDDVSSGVGREERVVSGELLVNAGKAIITLGKHFRAHGSRNNPQIELLLSMRADPTSAIDVFRVMGGYFAKGNRYPFKLEPVHLPFGKRSGPQFHLEIKYISWIVGAAVGAFPTDKPFKLTAKEIRDELDSIWSELSDEEQRTLVKTLAIDLQSIAELVPIIADAGDAKALEASGLGEKLEATKQRPRSLIEMFRFVYGYFKSSR